MENHRIAQRSVHASTCFQGPSETSQNTTQTDDGINNSNAKKITCGTCSYAMCCGTNGITSMKKGNYVAAKIENNGAFQYRTNRKTPEFNDGLSNTFFTGEVVESDQNGSQCSWAYTTILRSCIRACDNPLNCKL